MDEDSERMIQALIVVLATAAALVIVTAAVLRVF